MKILLLDNYDSFTYNVMALVHKVSDAHVEVIRNDKMKVSDAEQYDKIIFSPGPGIPSEAGILQEMIKAYAGKKSMLGVCLGHQAIGEVFGGKLINLEKVYHGIATPVTVIGDDYLFKDVPKTFKAGRYHSWVVDGNNFPSVLEVICEDENKQVMALKHKEYDIRGIQFHPESVLTEYGEIIMKNFLEK